MRSKSICLIIGMALLAATLPSFGQLGPGSSAPATEPAPDKDASRKKIDDLIAGFKKDKSQATLGLMQECMDTSIEYGAALWNQNDHRACAEFYQKTAQSLVDNFGDAGSATPLAAGAIADLKTALARMKGSNDADKNAWALRYAFDKAQLACEGQFSKMDGCLSLGSDYLGRKDLIDAQDSFGEATAMLAEMKGRDSEKLPTSWRVAPIIMANLQIVQKKNKEAAAAIAAGVAAAPEWAQSRMDLRAAFGGPDEFAGLVADLKTQSQNQPNDAGLQFLLGYETLFGGDREGAKEYFQKAIALDPSLKAAQIFLDAPPPPLDRRRMG